MSRRKTFEQLAHTRTYVRLKKITKLAEEICVDWYDSELGSVEFVAEDLANAIRAFEQNFEALWADFIARSDA